MGIYKVPVITEDIEGSKTLMEVFINTKGLIAFKTSMNGNFDLDDFTLLCINKETANELIKELKLLIKEMPNG
jgi:hypothetical protein